MIFANILFTTVIGKELDDDDDDDENTALIIPQNLESKHDAVDKHEEKHEPALVLIEKFCCLVIWPLSCIMPVQSFPELALALVFVLIYFLCEFILTVFNVFTIYTGLSHFLVGLTLMVWGSDNLEMINMAIAMKNGQTELGITSVMSCQIICMILIVPIAALARMETRGESEIQVMQA